MPQVLLPARLSSVPAARHWVAATYAELIEQGCCSPGAEVAVLQLLTTEAVANAVLHGAAQVGGQVGVQLSCREQVVRVAVSDDNPALPVVRRAGPQVIGGHGMALVETLSTRWGVQAPPVGSDGDDGSDGDGGGAGHGGGDGAVGADGSAGAGKGVGKSVWFELGTRT